PARAEALRAALPATQVETRASLERLEQKMSGRVPADDLAEELAEEQRALQEEAAKPTADDQRRIATALRTMPVPDAPLAQAEAIRQAERAAEAMSDPKHS